MSEIAPLAAQLANARAEVIRLERLALVASCAEAGHRWVLIGGTNCGCEDGCCSMPVNECKVCRDCDYGDNPEASSIRVACELREFRP